MIRIRTHEKTMKLNISSEQVLLTKRKKKRRWNKVLWYEKKMEQLLFLTETMKASKMRGTMMKVIFRAHPPPPPHTKKIVSASVHIFSLAHTMTIQVKVETHLLISFLPRLQTESTVSIIDDEVLENCDDAHMHVSTLQENCEISFFLCNMLLFLVAQKLLLIWRDWEGSEMETFQEKIQFSRERIFRKFQRGQRYKV